MNQFTVPQFIDVEDKIFGPITTRQFLILMVAGMLLFIVYKLADQSLFIFGLVTIGGFATILAFAKINGQSFHYFILNIVQTARRPSLRIWNRLYSDIELKELIKPRVVEQTEHIAHHQVNSAKIRDLSLLVNTGGYYKGE